jgi:hypothetical protein
VEDMQKYSAQAEDLLLKKHLILVKELKKHILLS